LGGLVIFILTNRPGLFENRVLRRIFGPKKDEVYNEELKLVVRKLEGRRPLRRPRLGGRIVLRWILQR
jgi:hypothetical protein